MIRPAVAADAEAMRDVERAAGEPFREIGLAAVADDEPAPAVELVAAAAAGRAFVDERDGVLAGYLLADVVDGCAHLEQVSVLPSMRGQRIGAALVEHLDGWARDHGFPAITLTTYRDVPWNGPYYARLGFTEVIDPGPGLRAIRAREIAHGLDVWPRLVMRRPVAARS